MTERILVFDDNNAENGVYNSEIIEDSVQKGPQSDKKSSQGLLGGLYEYIETFCYALALMILLFMFVFRYVSVDGESMRETLQHRDKLVISSLGYTPKTGDIVVLKFYPKPLIKRIIATEGQKVKIDYENWKVYIDGEELDEEYVRYTAGIMKYGSKPIEEFTVGEGMVYVMGDNRNNSKDSRSIGEFSMNDILGRVIFRVFPLSEFGSVDKR